MSAVQIIAQDSRFVMPAHCASKTRVNALTSRASMSFFPCCSKQNVDGRDKPGHGIGFLRAGVIFKEGLTVRRWTSTGPGRPLPSSDDKLILSHAGSLRDNKRHGKLNRSARDRCAWDHDWN
jgi:hypothetical protein